MRLKAGLSAVVSSISILYFWASFTRSFASMLRWASFSSLIFWSFLMVSGDLGYFGLAKSISSYFFSNSSSINFAFALSLINLNMLSSREACFSGFASSNSLWLEKAQAAFISLLSFLSERENTSPTSPHTFGFSKINFSSG